MITLRSVCYPAVTRPSPATAIIVQPLPRAHDADVAGSWHYDGVLRRSRVPYQALLLATAAHVLGLYGFNEKPIKEAAVIEEEIPQLVMVLPKLEDLEEVTPELMDAEADTSPLDSDDYVPMLADVPSVNIDSAFVQKLDFNSLQPRTDLSEVKVVTIPVGPRSGTRTVRGDMKNLFDIKDLDSPPTPVFQPSPVFPPALKREVLTATVVVEFIVNTRGKVSDVYVVDSSYRGFEDAAIAGVSRWQFRPGIKTGRAVNTRMRVPLIFQVIEE